MDPPQGGTWFKKQANPPTPRPTPKSKPLDNLLQGNVDPQKETKYKSSRVMELGKLFEQDSDRNLKTNKVEKVLAESKPNPTINKTFKLKKKEDSPGKQKTTNQLSLKPDILSFPEVKFGTCDNLNERNTLCWKTKHPNKINQRGCYYTYFCPVIPQL